MQKRLAVTEDGQLSFCTSSEENVGKGRCNHVDHQKDGESNEEFSERVEAVLINNHNKEMSEKFGPNALFVEEFNVSIGSLTDRDWAVVKTFDNEEAFEAYEHAIDDTYDSKDRERYDAAYDAAWEAGDKTPPAGRAGYAIAAKREIGVQDYNTLIAPFKAVGVMFKDEENKTSTSSIEDGVTVWENEKGELHRTDGPAVEYPDGSKQWFENGKFLREEGNYTHVVKDWYKEGNRFREEADGSKRLYKDGVLHNTEGPAVVYTNGAKEWWIGGERVQTRGSASSFKVVTDENGTVYSSNENGKLDREDGPAIEYADGSTAWYKNGNQHRIGGPAIETSDGLKQWYEEDQLHRDGDLPAVENPNGRKEFWLRGNFIRFTVS